MSLEVLNTVATLGTFFVIAATAVAALIQLRHVRSSNQIAALNELRESQQTEAFITALHRLYTELPRSIRDPEFRYQVAHRKERTEKYNAMVSSIETVGDSYENIGLLAKAGLVDRRILLDIYPMLVLDAWTALRDVTAILRAHYGSSLWENFEYLVVLSEDWLESHSDGTYPRGMRRIEVPNRWQKEDEQYALGRAATLDHPVST